MNSWLGHSKRDLILSFGPPSRSESDGQGGEILVYSRRVYGNFPSGVVDYFEHRMFYIDTQNSVYHWLITRNPNPPDRLDMQMSLKVR